MSIYKYELLSSFTAWPHSVSAGTTGASFGMSVTPTAFKASAVSPAPEAQYNNAETVPADMEASEANTRTEVAKGASIAKPELKSPPPPQFGKVKVEPSYGVAKAKWRRALPGYRDARTAQVATVRKTNVMQVPPEVMEEIAADPSGAKERYLFTIFMKHGAEWDSVAMSETAEQIKEDATHAKHAWMTLEKACKFHGENAGKKL